MDPQSCMLYNSGLSGAESAFCDAAKKWNIGCTVLSFAGLTPARQHNRIDLTAEELQRGDISMDLVSKMMHRTYYEAEKIRKVLQVIFHIVNRGHQVFAVGTILDDKTVKGGTGWAVELAKFFNRPLAVYDQVRKGWFVWRENDWHKESSVRISYDTFVGSGTRYLNDDGLEAINALFQDSFGPV